MAELRWAAGDAIKKGHRERCDFIGTLGRKSKKGRGDAKSLAPKLACIATFLVPLYFVSLVIASAALPAITQFADPATTASSSNHRYPKSSMHSGKSGLMMTYPGITAPGM